MRSISQILKTKKICEYSKRLTSDSFAREETYQSCERVQFSMWFHRMWWLISPTTQCPHIQLLISQGLWILKTKQFQERNENFSKQSGASRSLFFTNALVYLTLHTHAHCPILPKRRQPHACTHKTHTRIQLLHWPASRSFILIQYTPPQICKCVHTSAL